MTVKTICICGAGTMGAGIAQVSATAGYITILYDLNAEILHHAKEKILSGLSQLVSKKKITDDEQHSIFQNLTFSSDIQLCKADVVIEAIIEKLDAKVSLFNALASVNPSQTVFATNTSSLSVSAIADKIISPERVAGLHFFNPAPIMKLVEIVKGEQTAIDVITKLKELTNKMGKVGVVCKDAPGFIVNRVARPYYIEALRLVEEGVADFTTIDRLMESKGFKLGPFKLMDLIGNDVNYAVSCSVFDQLNQPERLKPSYIQKEKVDKGELGKKAGKGYYAFNDELKIKN